VGFCLGEEGRGRGSWYGSKGDVTKVRGER